MTKTQAVFPGRQDIADIAWPQTTRSGPETLASSLPSSAPLPAIDWLELEQKLQSVAVYRVATSAWVVPMRK